MTSDIQKGVIWVGVLLISSLAAGKEPTAASFDPFSSAEKSAGSQKNVVDKGPVIPQIQFSNNDISMAFQIIADATGWSIFPTEQAARAKISLWARGITAKDLLDTVVTLAGFIYHQDGSIITVMTYEEYMQYYGLAKNTIQLTYADAESVATVIKPFLTKLGRSIVHKGTNTIVLYEVDVNLRSVTGIIEKLDTPAENIAVEVINLRYADCQSLAAVLQQVFAGQKRLQKNKAPDTKETPAQDRLTTAPEKTGPTDVTVPYELVGIFPVSHANQLIVVGTRKDIKQVKDVVAIIDVYEDNMVLEVIDLKFADAEVIARTLQEVFSSKQSKDAGKSEQKTRTAPEPPPQKQTTEAQVEIRTALSMPQANVEVYSISRTNQVIVKAFRSDVEKLRELVEKLDVFIEPTTKNYHFTYVDASEINKGLERILDIYGRSGGRADQQAGSGGAGYGRDSGITLVERTNSILLTGPPSVHRIMSSICESVDVPGTYETGVIIVYKIENADVEEIAGTIKQLIEGKDEPKTKTGEPKLEKPSEAVPKPGTEGMSETEEFVPQIEAKVSVNKATNSIVVQATARQHRQLEKLIRELDVRRKQVLIKAMIIEVTANNDLDLGIELDYINGDAVAFTSFGLSTMDLSTGKRSIIVGPGGTAAVLGADKFRAILRALQSNDNVRIESAPQILVNDNAVGTIVSIAEEPTSQTNQGETTTTTSFGQYVAAGIQFAITPHISESNYLRVTYQITLNSFGEKADPTLPPARSTSNIQSEATIPDGATIVVGGLQSIKESESVDKVPLLGDIPLVGLAFRKTALRKQYITTYLFITTTIMKSEDFGDLKDVSKNAFEQVKANAVRQKPSAENTDAP